MTRTECQNKYSGHDLLFADGHDNAIKGAFINKETKLPCVVYDQEMVIDNLIKGGMEYSEAVEFFEFNIEGSYVGKYTPLYR